MEMDKKMGGPFDPSAPHITPKLLSLIAANQPAAVRHFGLDLGLQRARIERVEDVGVHAGLLGRNQVLAVESVRHYDEGQVPELPVGADMRQEIVTTHQLQVANHQAVCAFPQVGERLDSVTSMVDVMEVE